MNFLEDYIQGFIRKKSKVLGNYYIILKENLRAVFLSLLLDHYQVRVKIGLNGVWLSLIFSLLFEVELLGFLKSCQEKEGNISEWVISIGISWSKEDFLKSEAYMTSFSGQLMLLSFWGQLPYFFLDPLSSIIHKCKIGKSTDDLIQACSYPWTALTEINWNWSKSTSAISTETTSIAMPINFSLKKPVS